MGKATNKHEISEVCKEEPEAWEASSNQEKKKTNAKAINKAQEHASGYYDVQKLKSAGSIQATHTYMGMHTNKWIQASTSIPCEILKYPTNHTVIHIQINLAFNLS
jgi:hypothetical protein